MADYSISFINFTGPYCMSNRFILILNIALESLLWTKQSSNLFNYFSFLNFFRQYKSFCQKHTSYTKSMTYFSNNLLMHHIFCKKKFPHKLYRKIYHFLIMSRRKSIFSYMYNIVIQKSKSKFNIRNVNIPL